MSQAVAAKGKRKEEEEEGFCGGKNRRLQENRWDIPTCLNTVAEKALMEFKVKKSSPTPGPVGRWEQIRERSTSRL